MPDAVAEKLAHEQCGVIPARVPGAEHCAHERAGDPRPLWPPGHRHALPDRQPSHQRTRLPWPPGSRESRAGPQADTGMHARLSGIRQAGITPAARPSVAVRGKSTVHTDRPGGRIPVRYASVDTATQESTALQGDTRWDREETARIAAYPQLAGRFRSVWQV